jgi:small-conductance mechanosensitive channel
VVVNYPNSALANSVIVYFSDAPGPVRVRVRVQTGYDVDPEVVKAVTKKAIQQTEGVLEGRGRGVPPNELTSIDARDPFAGTPWHKFVPARVEALN